MQELEARGRVGASAVEVFSIVADVESWPQILRSVESMRLLKGSRSAAHASQRNPRHLQRAA
jgi:ribosome-associated toxin RatA of RatAB toxin-antitoxin module